MHRSRMACLPSLLLCLFGGVLAVGVFVLWAVTGDPSARARSATATPIMSTAMPTTVPTAQVRIETRVSGPAVAQGMRAQARPAPLRLSVARLPGGGVPVRLPGGLARAAPPARHPPHQVRFAARSLRAHDPRSARQLLRSPACSH